MLKVLGTIFSPNNLDGIEITDISAPDWVEKYLD
jgi:hypothetical protein